ncbi:SMP-30/gluconolactonase/LRE family protein [Paenibacillus solisilvae]|uniref:SMP-30/gluconolactonase/LRE family protein n=1 Tax=Paenibacillus solisilvae TaxID=2486751 RepID=A0ABW0VVC8_9BACL
MTEHQEQPRTLRFHSEWSRIVPEGTSVRKIADGFQFTEGPIWDREQAKLYFSDIPANRIYSWDSRDGLQLFREPSGNSNGLTLDRSGRLLACEHGNRRVSITDDDGRIRTLVESFGGKRLNSPNDIVVKSDGMIYFTDPPYGLSDPSEQEQPCQGVYRLNPDSSELELLYEGLHRPNGLAFSPDESILYVNDSSTQDLFAFDVTAEGTLSHYRLFARMDSTVGAGGPDGMKVDTEGNVYATGPGGIWVYNPAGEALGVLLVPEPAANLGWGGADRRTLYITANTSVYAADLSIPGISVMRSKDREGTV